MSRIHDALRKAELERGSGSPPETPAALHGELAATLEPPTAPLIRPLTSRTDERRESQIAPGMALEAGSALPAPKQGALQLAEIARNCAHPVWAVDPGHNVFADPQLTIDGAEQFRTLRSRLYQRRNEQSLRTLLVTSALPGEGKTFVTSNLGQAIVRQHERSALIIDGDLRRSRLHTPFGAPVSPGLSDYLRGDTDLLSVIQQGSQTNLFLIPGGSTVANPTELLANGRLKVLLERVADAFDWILLDTPPYLPVADANIMADWCDGILLVVKARSTASEVVQKLGREVQGRNVVGVVMNGVDENMLGYRSHYGSHYGTAYVEPGQQAMATSSDE